MQQSGVCNAIANADSTAKPFNANAVAKHHTTYNDGHAATNQHATANPTAKQFDGNANDSAKLAQHYRFTQQQTTLAKA